MPKLAPVAAISLPILPSPNMPRVRPWSAPLNDVRTAPRFMSAASSGMRRSDESMSAQVCSETV